MRINAINAVIIFADKHPKFMTNYFAKVDSSSCWAAAMFSSSVKPQLHVDNYIAGIKGSQSRQSLLSLYLVLIRYNNRGKKQQLKYSSGAQKPGS